jgi:peptide/nickel transport system permease protein
MGVGLVVGVIYVVINLIVDLLYGVIDPRVRSHEPPTQVVAA